MRISRKRIRHIIFFFALIIVCLAGYYFLQRWVFRKPNVILISIDTLRPSNLGCYGYHLDTSPNMDALAKDSVLFENVYCQQPHTLTSHMSILTSFYPTSHGVKLDRVLNARIPTLAETLKKNGYITAGFATSPEWLKSDFGFGRGFDLYEVDHWDAARLNREVFAWLEKHRYSPSPFFLFVHYYDVHSDSGQLPYDSPESFRGRFTKIRKDLMKYTDGSRYLKNLYVDRTTIGEDEVDYLEALYNGGVAFTDMELGRLFDKLRQLNLYEDSIIVVTADHGEEFQEHGGFLHFQIYDEDMRIPLIFKFPRVDNLGNLKVSTLAQSIDIMPTILDYLGIAPSPDIQQGKSLIPIEKPAPGDDGDAYLLAADSYAVRDGDWKLIFHPESDSIELYNTREDPAESSDVSRENPDTAKAMLSRLKRWLKKEDWMAKKYPADRRSVVNKEDIEILKSLGYID